MTPQNYRKICMKLLYKLSHYQPLPKHVCDVSTTQILCLRNLGAHLCLFFFLPFLFVNNLKVGLGLLEGLNIAQPRFPAASLRPAAEHALLWLQDLCGHSPISTATATPAGAGAVAGGAAAGLGADGMDVIEGDGDSGGGNVVPGTEGERLPKDAEAKQSEALAKRLDECGLKDGDKLGALFLALHQALLHVGSQEGAAQMAALWYGTALRCLRCVGKYPVREMGLGLVQDAIRMQPHPNAHAYATAGANRVRSRERVRGALKCQ